MQKRGLISIFVLVFFLTSCSVPQKAELNNGALVDESDKVEISNDIFFDDQENISTEELKELADSAKQGDAEAQHNLGVMYDNGQGVPQNYQEAMKWYRLAADQGLAEAQHNLGVMYGNGRGVPQNYQKAVKWFRLAADQGLAEAQYSLGVMYLNGQGVPKNYLEAMKWFRWAADQNIGLAQNNLGAMYEKGLGGVSKDVVVAYALYRISSDNISIGKEIVLENIEILKRRMLPKDIEAGETLLKEMRRQGVVEALDVYSMQAI